MGGSVFTFMNMRTMQYPDLRGRVVVVTGAGRPQGIGAAICRGFADQGCTIFLQHIHRTIKRCIGMILRGKAQRRLRRICGNEMY